MTVMGEPRMDGLSDRGSIPLRSIGKILFWGTKGIGLWYLFVCVQRIDYLIYFNISAQNH